MWEMISAWRRTGREAQAFWLSQTSLLEGGMGLDKDCPQLPQQGCPSPGQGSSLPSLEVISLKSSPGRYYCPCFGAKKLRPKEAK